MDPNVAVRSDPLAMARAFACTPGQNVHFQGFLLYCMEVARGFEHIYRTEMRRAPPGLDLANLQAHSAYASSALTVVEIGNICALRAVHPDAQELLAALGTKAPAADIGRLTTERDAARAEVARLAAQVQGLQDAVAEGARRGTADLVRAAAAKDAEILRLSAEVQRLTHEWNGARTAADVSLREAGRLEAIVDTAAAAMHQLSGELRTQLGVVRTVAGGALTPAQAAALDDALRLVGGAPAAAGAGGGEEVTRYRDENRRLRVVDAQKTAEINRLTDEARQAAEDGQGVVGRVGALLDFRRIKTDMGARLGQIGALGAADPLAPLRNTLQNLTRYMFMWHCVFPEVMRSGLKTRSGLRVMNTTRPPDELGGLKNVLDKTYGRMNGTSDSVGMEAVVGNQREAYGALRSNQYAVEFVNGGWERVMMDAAPADQDICLLDSYSTFTSSTVLLLHMSLQSLSWYLELIGNFVIAGDGVKPSDILLKSVMRAFIGMANNTIVKMTPLLAKFGGVASGFNRVLIDDMSAGVLACIDTIMYLRILSKHGMGDPRVLPAQLRGVDLRGLFEATNNALKNLNKEQRADGTWYPCSAAVLNGRGVTDAAFLSLVHAT